ncbi:MlaD family protein [Pseudonocardia spinosispora]|uniref:MlaD family protein n=1 Tax=Pseudonocardia spinosispora TaxID=103441 RepID=UPI0003FDD88B|nr:MlaD family protein [Pseudonocardia spinosispora]
MKNFFMKIFGGEVVHGHRTLSAWKLGAGFLVVVLIVGWGVFNKAKVTTWLTPGETIKVHFASDYRLRPYFSQAKVSFVPVGMVTGVEEQPDRTAVVSVKLYSDNKGRLGTEPSAVIRPTTLLGGNYFLDLVPGGGKGAFNGEIPLERTHLPVELDKIARAFQPNALAGMKGTLEKFDNTLQGGGREALQRLAADAPGSLKPTSQVLDALRGTNPERDLTNVVSGLEHASQALSEPKGRLDGILSDLATTSAMFGRRSADFSTTLDELPAALHSANKGFNRLNTTLDVLDDTVDDIRPSVQQLDDTLDHIDPVLEHARPVVSDLRDVLHDAREVLHDLPGNVDDLNDVLDDLRGPVLDRVNGPVSQLILNPFHGTGPYAQTDSNKPLFKELAYAVANLDRTTEQNKDGSAIGFEATPWAEPFEGLVQNDGQGRAETATRILTDSQRLNPAIQSPGEAPAATQNNPQIPLLGGSSDKGGR